MRQSAQKIEPPSWKEEVNRRIAEHNERKGQPVYMQSPATEAQPAESASAKAAARVAARYAKVPSYSELRAEEARAAVRAAEAASKAALQAQAAAESVLAGLEADIEANRPPAAITIIEAAPAIREADLAPNLIAPTAQSVARPARLDAGESARLAPPQPSAAAPAPPAPSYAIRWDADMPGRPADTGAARATRGPGIYEVPVDSAWQPARDAHDPHDFAIVEAAQPIHANLIRFPRELVATRKVRPRRDEGGYADAQSQLSIFEVEPWAVSTEPGASNGVAAVVPQTWAGRDFSRKDLAGPDWSSIQLEPEPQLPAGAAPAAARRTAVANALPFELAPVSQRLMATLVDFSLITTSFVAAACLALMNVKTMPSMRTLEVASVFGIALVALLYQAFFFTLAESTPGMRYARLRLCTLSGETMTLTQKYRRAAALVLSLLPAGLGVVSAIVDEQFLCWHDRFSGTYLRQG